EKVVYPNESIEAFSYDKVGNRVKRTLNSQVTSYTYDSRNRLTSLIEGENPANFQYDNQGNLISEANKQGTTKYTYDCFNRTTGVQKQDGNYIKNSYDPEGLRDKVEENGVVSKFVFDRGSVVTELDGEDNLKVASIRGIEIVSQRDSKNDSYYYLNNYHGDVVNLTDILGNIVNSYSYDAFGNTLEASEQVHNRFRYSGEQFDSVTNQYYLRARFYNPVVGRFTQEDEYRGDGLNLYAYVGSNPVNYFDPTGYATQCEKKIYSRQMTKEEWQEYMRLQRTKTRDGKMSQSKLDELRENIANGFRSKGNPEKQLLSGSEWNKYFRSTYGGKNVKWKTKETDEIKRIAVGESGHHVPAVRKSKGRAFAVGREDKTRPTLFSLGTDPGHDHWRLHDAEREFVGPRQGDFQGTDAELFDAYRNAYKNLDDISVDVKSPNNTHILGENVTPSQAVDLMQNWLRENGLWIDP
ncbi:RHS repeat domain-containing protein, partial [Clostridium sp. DJ247]|uniref:RHS repeat domain-containing protein n=1 Tax=Clostridium sp. DJ247 TaxID=2726188 RepID=UPI001626C197